MNPGPKTGQYVANPGRPGWWIIGCLLTLFLSAGCSEKDRIPSNIIPPAKMEKILWDMIQADQYSDLYFANDSAGGKTKMETLRLYQQIFQLHQVTREDFRKSFQYYIGRPDLSRGLLDSALVQGNRERALAITSGGYKSPPAIATTPAKGSNPAFPFHPFTKPGSRIPGMPPGHAAPPGNAGPAGYAGQPGYRLPGHPDIPPKRSPSARPRRDSTGRSSRHMLPATP